MENDENNWLKIHLEGCEIAESMIDIVVKTRIEADLEPAEHDEAAQRPESRQGQRSSMLVGTASCE